MGDWGVFMKIYVLPWVLGVPSEKKQWYEQDANEEVSKKDALQFIEIDSWREGFTLMQ